MNATGKLALGISGASAVALLVDACAAPIFSPSCQGGAATDSWDGLGALVDWVEKGNAPQQIIARGTTVFPGRSRPLCPYPQSANYRGTGNPEDAASFVCR